MSSAMDCKKAPPLSLMEDDFDLFDLPRMPSPAPSGRFSLRRSTQSFQSSPEPDTTISCVSRDTPSDDCDRDRFVVWAAVKRNRSVRMTDEERLECPMLRCTKRFANHELMLMHLVKCDQLSLSTEYWCFEHSRVERFDDRKCKKCLAAHSSRRRRMLYMAKNFFTSLGHRSRRGHEKKVAPRSPSPLPPPPPSYDSLHAELPSDCIMEIDSVEVSALPGPAEPSIDPQALLLPELDSVSIPAIPFVQWPMAPLASDEAIDPRRLHSSMDPFAKPMLQLNTTDLGSGQRSQRPRPVVPPASRSKNLSPSSSVRSNASTMSNISSIISPISTWSHGSAAWSGIGTAATSPTTDLVSPIDFFAEPDFGGCSDLSGDSAFVPQLPAEFLTELPADVPSIPSIIPDLLVPDSLSLPFETTYNAYLSYESDVVTGEKLAEDRTASPSTVKDAVTFETTESPLLIMSAWDALLQHILSSLNRIQDIEENSLADELNCLSATSIATTGLRVLRALLEGQAPTSPIDAICFVHLAYALTLATYEDDTPLRSEALFLQSLAYNYYFDLDQQRQYTQLVLAIWNPGNMPSDEVRRRLWVKLEALRELSTGKGKGKDLATYASGDNIHKDDALLLAAQDFLDGLESSIIVDQSVSPKTSDLWNIHLDNVRLELPSNSPFHFAATYILDMLRAKYSAVNGLGAQLQVIEHRLRLGLISSVRRLELEVLQAGKQCMPMARFADKFAPEVRQLCDSLYEQHGLPASSSHRNAYYRPCIALIESSIMEMSAAVTVAEPLSESLDGLVDTFTNQLGNDYAQSVSPTDKSAMRPGGTTAPFPEASPVHPTPDAIAEQQQQQQQQPAEPQVSPSNPAAPAATTTTTEEDDGGEEAPPRDAKAELANSCCDICGYRPKGDPQWFKGSMAKHRKLQHSAAPPRIYKCPFPGCASQYRNRPDNLRQHQAEKKHWVEGEEPRRRPSKRKKVSD